MQIHSLKGLMVFCCLVSTLFHKIQCMEVKENASFVVERIQKTLLEQAVNLEQARGSDIVVLLGNTGSGKTTIINLLAEAPLKLDSSARVVADGSVGFRVESGSHSITKYPAFLQTRGSVREAAVRDKVGSLLCHNL